MDHLKRTEHLALKSQKRIDENYQNIKNILAENNEQLLLLEVAMKNVEERKKYAMKVCNDEIKEMGDKADEIKPGEQSTYAHYEHYLLTLSLYKIEDDFLKFLKEPSLSLPEMSRSERNVKQGL